MIRLDAECHAASEMEPLLALNGVNSHLYHMHLDENSLQALAPAQLANRRTARYGGGGMGVRMSDLAPDDEARIRALYLALSSLLGELRLALRIPAGDGAAPGGFSNGSPDVGDTSADEIHRAVEVLQRTAEDPRWIAAINGTRALRYPSTADSASEEAVTLQRQALHDVRSGALAALTLTLELIRMGGATTADVVRCFYLTRDHLKIMRNALEDIDAVARERDRGRHEHGSDLLFEKWSAATHRQAPDRWARVEVNSNYDGPVSRRCLEFSALDRVLYNLMNNAVRFTSDGVVELYLRSIGDNLRFVVVNAASPEQQALLDQSQGDTLGNLFLGGFTTGGEGVGLSICGEFVANAYGLADAAQAVEGGHVGATSVDGAFVAWFHWPLGA